MAYGSEGVPSVSRAAQGEGPGAHQALGACVTGLTLLPHLSRCPLRRWVSFATFYGA